MRVAQIACSDDLDAGRKGDARDRSCAQYDGMHTQSRSIFLTVDPAVDHAIGKRDAAVTVVEYGDFECPSCAQAYAALKVLHAEYGPAMRFVFRHFPLREVHPHAERAAEAAEAAGAQHRFWEMHNLLFEHQRQLDDDHLLVYARQLRLDIARFENELRDQVYRQRVQEHVASGEELKLRATPSFFVNEKFVDVSFGLEQLRRDVAAAFRTIS